ncbi:MAG: NAD-dependent epimerase/dehydratase family protein [Candidatus Cohnella colombiensis]|uniref:NAD-dependent epimerase/dehydratase family protein n=1 Tax=Candidatus Cohnella colombiensis TaxID=3121368 RepID=A0AA95JFD7_9BACL|nr:MAG: NAD-dependent epimerase/dehydratase family protein [Cohnella sp.]
MNIIVTGAGGFIGQALLEEFARDSQIWAIGRQASPQSLRVNERWNVTDLSDDAQLPIPDPLIAWEVLIHAAGTAHIPITQETEAMFWQGNVQATVNAVKLAQQAGVKHFILISSIAAATEEDGDLYARTKRMAEKYTLEECARSGIKCTVLRPVMVYGEYDVKGNMMKLIHQLHRRFVPLPDRGRTIKPMIYIRNFTWIVRQVIEEAEQDSTIRAVRDVESWSTYTLCRIVTTLMERRCLIIPLPKWSDRLLLIALRTAKTLHLFNSVNENSYRKLSNSLDVAMEPWLLALKSHFPYTGTEGLRKTVNGFLESKR